MNKDALQEKIIGGIQAGGLEAIKQARRYGTNLAIWRDGKTVEITPDEAEAMLTECEAEKEE